MSSYLKAFIIIIVLMFLITFGIENNQSVHLSYYFDLLNFPMPLYGLIYISVLIGILLGMAVGLTSRYQMRKKLKHLERENRVLKEELKNEAKNENEEVEGIPS